MSQSLSETLQTLANPEIAAHSQRFFKTGKGEYGENDVFLGIRTPALREQAKRFKTEPLNCVLESLRSPYHEERLCALFLMVLQFSRGSDSEKTAIYQAYLEHTDYVNNWDLVDSSCHKIMGPYLFEKNRQILYRLAESDSLWERRIAMMTTYYFIKHDQYQDTLRLAEILRDDKEDLIHKVAGWMLREVGKRDVAVEKDFLQQHYQHMPRTMLRYAIEKFPAQERKRYLAGVV